MGVEFRDVLGSRNIWNELTTNQVTFFQFPG